MRVDAFDFVLPDGRIATAPASPRDAARMLVVRQGFSDRCVRDLVHFLRPEDCLVVNDTHVFPARLEGMRRGAKVECLLHRPVQEGVWTAFARPAKRLAVGDRIIFAPTLQAEVVKRLEEGEVVLDFALPRAALMAELAVHGKIPLPPYIAKQRPVTPEDAACYQTVYACAEHSSSIAAPTAGLHFTPALLDAVDAMGVARVAVTLHVGGGTFLPVKVEDTRDHRMHSESFAISGVAADTINARRRTGGRIIAVGTTSLRALESAVQADGSIRACTQDTRLFITPGYRCRAVDMLLTNFHLPRSTLFMLVSAFAGLDTMHAAYAHAIREHYRFYSYGDACLLYP